MWQAGIPVNWQWGGTKCSLTSRSVERNPTVTLGTNIIHLFIYLFFGCLDIMWRYINIQCRSQWSRRLRRRSAATRLLRSWVRISPEAWMFVCCECCVLSGRGLCDELITRPEESYRLWCVFVCDLETSGMRRPWHALGRSATKKKWIFNKSRSWLYSQQGKQRT
jgi:hypothetical protein